MDIKEYYRRIYKREWEDIESNRKIIFKRRNADAQENQENLTKKQKGRSGKSEVPLAKKLLHYSVYLFFPVLMVPLVLWIFDFLGAAVIVMISDMELLTKLSLLSLQVVFTVLIAVSVRIIVQRFFFPAKEKEEP